MKLVEPGARGPGAPAFATFSPVGRHAPPHRGSSQRNSTRRLGTLLGWISIRIQRPFRLEPADSIAVAQMAAVGAKSSIQLTSVARLKPTPSSHRRRDGLCTARLASTPLQSPAGGDQAGALRQPSQRVASLMTTSSWRPSAADPGRTPRSSSRTPPTLYTARHARKNDTANALGPYRIGRFRPFAGRIIPDTSAAMCSREAPCLGAFHIGIRSGLTTAE
jgi:hypothetical protein